MSNVVLIPARGGSKGIKLKNITLIDGKPLLYYSANSCQNAKDVDKIIVATDSQKIANTAKSFNFNKLEVYKRLKKNAQDTSKTIDLVLEYVKYLSLDDTLILVQATSPLITANDIECALNKYKEQKCDSLFSCTIAEGFYWDIEGNPILHDYKNRKRRQDYQSQILKENGAIYINKVKNIIQNKSLLSGKIKPYIMDTELEIDNPDDISKAEKCLRQRKLANINFKNFKMFLVDCDGTMTDGGMYYSKDGELLKKFNAKDGFGLNQLRNNGFIVGIVTGENNEIVRKRAEKLKINELYMGSNDKLPIIKNIAKKHNISLDEIVFIGDDLNDYDVIQNVGFGCATANANEHLKNIAAYVTKTTGGMGAVREVSDLILDNL